MDSEEILFVAARGAIAALAAVALVRVARAMRAATVVPASPRPLLLALVLLLGVWLPAGLRAALAAAAAGIGGVAP